MKLSIVVAAALLAHAAPSLAATLSLPEAQRLAAERSRQLAAQDFAISASREMAVAAGQLPDPMLKFGIENLPIEGAGRFSVARDFMTMRRIGIMQELPRAEKRQLRSERFEREADRGMAEKVAALAAIQRDTAFAWLDRYYAEAIAALIAEQMKEAQLEVESAQAAYRSGRGGQADFFSARAVLAALQDRASEAARRIRTAKTALARWVGETAAELPLAGRPDIDAVRLDPRNLEGELAHHPEIAILERQAELAEVEAKLARANRKPDWSVEAMYQQRGSAFSDMISIGAAIPLQWDRKNRQDRELAAKLAMVEEVRARRDESLRAHVRETEMRILEWENSRERRARYQRELVPLAQERTAALLAAYRGGRSSLADVIASRRAEVEFRLQAIQLEAESARLWAYLNFLVPDGAGAGHDRSVTGTAGRKAR